MIVLLLRGRGAGEGKNELIELSHEFPEV
jgi:hypothetical protein